MKLIKALALSLVLIFLNSCAASSGSVQNNGTQHNKPTTQKLEAFKWKVIAIQNGSKVLDDNIAGVSLKKYQLVFQKSSFSLKGVCNQIGGNTQIENGNIRFSSIFSTKMLCQRAFMNADKELVKILKGITNYRLEANNTLILNGHNAGRSLLLRGTPTSETKYDGKGVRKFIQIKNTAQGLVWREAKYNSKYIQINKNAHWNTGSFPGIEGFKPLSNREYNIRVNEFYDAQQGKKIWIKDMVVMQGVLR